MSGFITQNSLQRLQDSIDIVDLISSYIDVKKVGINYMALCPFHNERTPSMSISQAKGLYHCHGCGASGNAITFVMQYEKISFPEAAQKVANFFSIDLEYENSNNFVKKSEILPSVALFYHNNLFKHKEILEYLYNRGITQDSINKFEIGYSGMSYETINFLNAKNLSHNEALEYGILSKGASKDYAKFANRVIFPIYSKSGVVVGFGGRIIDNSKNLAKYINSPQSKVFNKSKILYGYNLAKSAINRENSIIICEGYLDVIMLHQAGFNNAVATLGTAFNDGHLSLLNRDNPRIFMCYDGDNAGINAAFKASKLLSQNSKDGGVIILKDGLDPADMIAQGKIADFKILVQNAKSFVDFVLEHIIMQFNLNNPIQKENALKAVLEYLHTLSPILQDSYKQKCAFLLDINPIYIKTKFETNIKNNDFISPINTQDSNNFAEESILINMLESNEYFLFALNFLSKKYFETYGDEFELITKGEINNQKIDALKFKSNVKILNNDEFKEQVRIFILKYANTALSNINLDSNISPAEKIKKIFNLKDSIFRLKNGEILSI